MITALYRLTYCHILSPTIIPPVSWVTIKHFICVFCSRWLQPIHPEALFLHLFPPIKKNHSVYWWLKSQRGRPWERGKEEALLWTCYCVERRRKEDGLQKTESTEWNDNHHPSIHPQFSTIAQAAGRRVTVWNTCVWPERNETLGG